MSTTTNPLIYLAINFCYKSNVELQTFYTPTTRMGWEKNQILELVFRYIKGVCVRDFLFSQGQHCGPIHSVVVTMKHLIVLSVVVVGCFATAQLHAERTRYRPINPFRSDSLRSSASVPLAGAMAKVAVPPTVLGSHQIRLMLDAHIVCLSELKDTKDRLDDINLVIEQFKMEVRADISNINNQLELFFASYDVDDVKLKLQANSELLADTILNLGSLEDKFTDMELSTSDVLMRYQKEINGTIEEHQAQQSEIADNLSERIESLSTELDDVKQQLNDTDKGVEDLANGLTATDFAIADLMLELNVTKEDALKSNSRIDQLASSLYASTNASSIGKIPRSCEDLKQIGHVKSGLHLIMGNKGVDSVYCDFTLDDKEQWIGHTDVKTAPVYFSVQRTSRFNKTNVPIPFDLAKSTIGNAIDLSTGVFTAPRTGTYFFIFNGLAEFKNTSNVIPYLAVGLFLNKSGNRIALALTEEAQTVKDQYRGQRVPLALQTTIQLQKGDQVWLEIFAESGTVSLFDNKNNHSAFTGWLMEEEISL
ncbi:uncharacterized protein LOC130698044 [Daphnia carinata]|uniref:uncharacterized protein LOC130698044 n=1 Tax=Daphnia carinata TaxID=120202 RepID=UPI00257D9A1F|nr:uncharacterized protein LOC130698044 [Daphnia carinata]